MMLEAALEGYGLAIEERLKKFFNKLIEDAESYHPIIGNVYSTLKEYVLRRGKRIASYTTLLTYQGYKAVEDERIMCACMGIELYRHSILVHDDLVDRDTVRRGGKTVHKTFQEKYGERFGEGAAIFLGNIAYTLAQKALLESGFEDWKMAKVMKIVSEEYRAVNESQILDLIFEQKDVSEKEWYTMASKRAASLFKTSILTGAILAEASEEDISILDEAAEHIGYAFDIQDDIIDTYASQEQYGRPPCGDFKLAKKPLHVALALNSENKAASDKLKALLGKKLNKREVETVRSLIKDTSALEKAKEHARKHVKEAGNLIAKTKLNSESKQLYNQLLNYIEESLEWYK